MRAHLRPLLVLLVSLIPSALWAQSDGTRDLSRALERLAKGEQITGLPQVDSVTRGARVVPAGTSVKGSVVAQGPVEVAGTVDGSVVSLGGDVTVRRGGHVTGLAFGCAGAAC